MFILLNLLLYITNIFMVCEFDHFTAFVLKKVKNSLCEKYNFEQKSTFGFVLIKILFNKLVIILN